MFSSIQISENELAQWNKENRVGFTKQTSGGDITKQ